MNDLVRNGNMVGKSKISESLCPNGIKSGVLNFLSWRRQSRKQNNPPPSRRVPIASTGP